MFTSIINLHNNLVMLVGSEVFTILWLHIWENWNRDIKLKKKKEASVGQLNVKSRSKQKKINFKGAKINKSRWGSELVKTSFLQEYNIRHLTVWANIFTIFYF